MFIHRQKQKGMVLICAVAILAVLSIMATSFVRMMTLNLQAAKNHLNYVDAKFAAIAGIEDAKAKMWAYMLTRNNDTTDTRISYNNNLYSNHIFQHDGIVGRTTNRGKIGRYDYNGNQYKFRIRSNQGKLNLNSHRPHNITNTTYIQNSNRVMNNIIKYLAIECDMSEQQASNLAEELRPVNTEIKTFKSMEEVELIVKRYGNNSDFLNNVCVNSVIDSLCYVPIYTTNRDSLIINQNNTSYYREYRSPININSVSIKLLTAIIKSIKAIVYIYKPSFSLTDDYGFTTGKIQTEKTFLYAKKEYKIDFGHADNASIVTTFVNLLHNTNTNTIKYKSISDIESIIQSASIIGIEKNDTKDIIREKLQKSNIYKDVLKANFNPNVRENFYNGAYTSARYAQKSDLYFYDDTAKKNVPTHSTELCILDFGYSDIEANGIIQARVTDNPVTVAKASIKESISFGTIVSLTSYNDFYRNKNKEEYKNAWANAWIFPEVNENNNKISTSMNNLTSFCGSVQGKYHEYKGTSSIPTNFVKTKDGILMKHSFYSSDSNSNTYTPIGISASSIGSTSGTISFWVKLSENWYEPTMCALFSGSYRNPVRRSYTKYPVQYNTNGYAKTSNYHDGIQMYIYKNTKGELRFSRLFFCGYFNTNCQSDNKDKTYHGIESLAVDVATEKLPNQNIKYARRDILIDLASTKYQWKANEWHHISVSWNDTLKTTHGFYAKIDEKDENIHYCLNDGENTETSPKFCILNENNNLSSESTDSNGNSSLVRVQMNSMHRNQHDTETQINQDKRLFRFKQVADLPGNSTMSENGSSITSSTLSTLSLCPISFDFNTTNMQDPNINPYLNYEKKKVTPWGIIGTLTWTAYPDGTNQVIHSYMKPNPTINATPLYIIDNIKNTGNVTISSTIHQNYTGAREKIIILKDNNISTQDLLVGTSFECQATFQNETGHPTVLDSITLNIMYPVTFSSTIVQ